MSADYDPTEKDPLLSRKGGDDDDDDDNEWANRDLSQQPVPEEDREKWHFPPDPNPSGGEEIQMATRLPTEKQGASESTAETSSMKKGRASPVTLENRARKEIEDDFPNADWIQLNFRDTLADRSGGAIIEVKYHTRDKWYPLFTKSPGDLEKTLNTASLSKVILKALGPYKPKPQPQPQPQPQQLDAAIAEENAALQEKHKQEETQRKALQQAETKAAEAQRLRREMHAIQVRTKDAEDRIQQLENTHGPLDKEAIQKLKDEKRKLAAGHQAKRKQLDAVAKAAKEAQKLQQDINKTRLSKGETARRLGQLKAQKDALQPLEELKQKSAELNEHITEDMRIIEDENTSPSERKAARERLAVRNEELEMVNKEIGVRERQRPLLERLKEIFKKYCWTLQAVVLAVGVVLSALALAGLNGIKAGTKAVGKGLKTIGQKLGSLLPGLIGSIVSFIFKAAGQVLSFLGEHAWLLILAVVAFFMERLLKKRRKQ